MVYRSLLCLLVAPGSSAGSTPPSPGDSAVTVFTSPREAGADERRWTCYRIPLLILVNDTLLCAEARSYTGDG